jgi:hypothetical protein
LGAADDCAAAGKLIANTSAIDSMGADTFKIRILLLG